MPSMAIRWNHAASRGSTGSVRMRLELALKVPEAGTELSLRDGPVRLATIRQRGQRRGTCRRLARSRCRRIR